MGKEATAKLKKLSEREEVTMFMVLMGATRYCCTGTAGRRTLRSGRR